MQVALVFANYSYSTCIWGFFQGLPKNFFDNFVLILLIVASKHIYFSVSSFNVLHVKCWKTFVNKKRVVFLIKYNYQLTVWKLYQIHNLFWSDIWLSEKKNVMKNSKTCFIIWQNCFSNLWKEWFSIFLAVKSKTCVCICTWSFWWCVKYQMALWTLFSFFCASFPQMYAK